MQQIKIMSIAGARPNFMKLAAISCAIRKHNENFKNIRHIIVHTGQHYDQKMSKGFFDELGIPKPDINLEVGSASHAVQTAEIMKRFEPILMRELPDILLVVGDVNSTIACALVASKIEYAPPSKRKRPIIVHVEAGLRSHDRDMPEEINRILTDALSDRLFVTEQSGIDNLKMEGVASDKIYLVGNVMIDTLQHHLEKAKQSTIMDTLSITQPYCLVTLHRPSNVDTPEALQPLLKCLAELSEKIPIIFPIHPRTKNNILKFGLDNILNNASHVMLADPLGYLDFLHLTSKAHLVVTDSGGIQEETTYLGIPCITLRNNTERPVTVDVGTNYLIGTSPQKILFTVDEILGGKNKAASVPKYWDGKSGDRIIGVLTKSFL